MGNEKWDMGNGEMKKWGNGDGNDTTDYTTQSRTQLVSCKT